MIDDNVTKAGCFLVQEAVVVADGVCGCRSCEHSNRSRSKGIRRGCRSRRCQSWRGPLVMQGAMRGG